MRQGCTLSLWPFNLFLDNIVREARESYQGGVQLEFKHFLMFADDLALVNEKDKDMKRNVEGLNEVMTKWKMKINKVLVVQRGGGTCHIDGVEVEGVKTAKYLEAVFNEEGS